jgi:hypothetical protein
MILRKVSNLRPGDRVKLHDSLIEVEEIEPSEIIDGKIRVHFADAPSRDFLEDDLVEIVIL